MHFQTQMLRTLLPAARRRGVVVEPLLARFELPADAADRDEVSLPFAAFVELVDELAASANDPWFGLHAAMEMPRGAYGLLEFSCRSAATLRGAVERTVRYFTLLNKWESVTATDGVDETRIELHNPYIPRGTGRHGSEYFVGLLVAMARELGGDPAFAPRRAWFSHAAPGELGELHAQLGTKDLAFDRETNGIAVAAVDLARPVISADAELLAVLDHAVAQQLKHTREDTTSSDVARFVYRALAEREPIELADASTALETHPRALQRALSEEGKSYGDVVDGVRLDLARIFLLEDKGSLETLSEQLGYSDLRAFLRAFERWTGGPPSKFRR